MGVCGLTACSSKIKPGHKKLSSEGLGGNSANPAPAKNFDILEDVQYIMVRLQVSF